MNHGNLLHDPNYAFLYSQYLICSGGIHPSYHQLYDYMQTYYSMLNKKLYYSQPVYYHGFTPSTIPIYNLGPGQSSGPGHSPVVHGPGQSPVVHEPVQSPVQSSESEQNSKSITNENHVIDIKPSEHKQEIPTNFTYNKKYGKKDKDECLNGMSCKDIYCKFFHHPSADEKIFYQK